MKVMMNLILTLLILASCKSHNFRKEINDIDSLIVSIYNSNENLSPLILHLEIPSKKIILFNTRLKTYPTPIPPDSLSKNNNVESEKIIFEVINLLDSEIRLLQAKLLEFRENDFEDKMAFADEGMGVTLNIIYNDNEFKNITLINNSTDKQKEFFKIFTETVKKHSVYSILLNEYFKNN